MDDFKMARAKNAAENGRLFCVLLLAVALFEHLPTLALMAAIPVGAAAIIDRIENHRLVAVASLLTVVWAASVAIAILVNLW